MLFGHKQEKMLSFFVVGIDSRDCGKKDNEGGKMKLHADSQLRTVASNYE